MTLEALIRVGEIIANRDAPAVFAMVKEMEADGEDWHDALHQLTEHYRRLLLVSVGGPVVAEELTPTEVAMLQLEARFFSPQQLVACYAAFHRAHHTPAGMEVALLEIMTLTGEPFATAPIVFPTTSDDPHAELRARTATWPPDDPASDPDKGPSLFDEGKAGKQGDDLSDELSQLLTPGPTPDVIDSSLSRLFEKPGEREDSGQ